MSECWSVELTSEFPMGAGIQLRSPEPGRITFMAPWDRSPQPLWFHFRVDNTPKGKIRFDLLNADQCLGGPRDYRQLRVCPIFTTDAPSPAPSKRRWRRVAQDAVSYQNGVYSFSVEADTDTLTVAHCYPYGPVELGEFVEEFSGHSTLKADDFCRSGLGNRLPRVRVERNLDAPIIWLAARLHAGEVGGTWAMEGLLRWLLGGAPEAEWLLERYRFHAFPMVDIDGVLNGWYGKERAPLDFNRAWLADSPRPEVRAIEEAILSPGDHSALVLDFHCPSAGDPSMLFLPLREVMPKPQWELCKLIADRLLEESPAEARLTSDQIKAPTYMGHEWASTLTGAIPISKGIPGLSIEVSYGYQNVSGGAQLTQESYRAYGAAIGRALASALRTMPEAAAELRGSTPLAYARPFEEYSGEGFRGCFPWTPPHLARLRSQYENSSESLIVELDSSDASVNLSLPPLPLSMGRKNFRLTLSLSGSPVKMDFTFFGIAESGLWLRWTSKASTTLSPSTEPRALTFQPEPPPSVQHLAASVVISGGPARIAITPPM